jgi:hypothetical protein
MPRGYTVCDREGEARPRQGQRRALAAMLACNALVFPRPLEIRGAVLLLVGAVVAAAGDHRGRPGRRRRLDARRGGGSGGGAVGEGARG